MTEDKNPDQNLVDQPEQTQNPSKDDAVKTDVSEDSHKKKKWEDEEVLETSADPSDEPVELTSGIYHQMLRLLQEMEEEKKKNEEEQNKKRLADWQKQLEDMQKEAEERAQGLSSAQQQILGFVRGRRGEDVFQGGENAYKVTLFEELNQSGFFERLKSGGREIEIDDKTGAMKIHYADGGHMKICQNEQGKLTISLHGTKMDDQKAHDNVFMQRMCGSGSLTIKGPKKGARLLWKAAQEQGLVTNDHTKGAFKPSNGDVAWANSLKKQRNDISEQQQKMADDGMLDLASMSQQKFQGVQIDAMQGKIPHEEFMQTVHSFGRLQNLIGYDLDHDGQVKYMGTDLSEDDIKEIREDLEHDFSPEMMENIIDDLNQDQKELKSLLMPATLEQQELQLNAMEKSKKGWRGVVMKVLANKEAKENFEQQKEGLRAAIEDSRSRFMRKSHDLDQDQSPSNSADKLKDMGSAFGATPAEQEKPAARKLPAFIGHSAKPNKP